MLRTPAANSTFTFAKNHQTVRWLSGEGLFAAIWPDYFDRFYAIGLTQAKMGARIVTA